jgi:hypothetical protein
MRFVICAFALIVLAQPGSAAVPDYCAAYARDYADVGTPAPPEWRLRYDKAEKACLFQYSEDTPEPVKKPKAKVAVAEKPKAKVPVAKKPEQKPLKKLDTKPAEKPEAAALAEAPPQPPAKLVLGTPAWKAYCKRKYVSFNPDKGTYTSKTGKERPCIVTADFK